MDSSRVTSIFPYNSGILNNFCRSTSRRFFVLQTNYLFEFFRGLPAFFLILFKYRIKAQEVPSGGNPFAGNDLAHDVAYRRAAQKG